MVCPLNILRLEETRIQNCCHLNNLQKDLSFSDLNSKESTQSIEFVKDYFQ